MRGFVEIKAINHYVYGMKNRRAVRANLNLDIGVFACYRQAYFPRRQDFGLETVPSFDDLLGLIHDGLRPNYLCLSACATRQHVLSEGDELHVTVPRSEYHQPLAQIAREVQRHVGETIYDGRSVHCRHNQSNYQMHIR